MRNRRVTFINEALAYTAKQPSCLETIKFVGTVRQNISWWPSLTLLPTTIIPLVSELGVPSLCISFVAHEAT